MEQIQERVIQIFSQVGLPFPLAAYRPSIPYLGAGKGVLDSIRDVARPSTPGGGIGSAMVDDTLPEAVEALPEFGEAEVESGQQEVQPVELVGVQKNGTQLTVRIWPEVLVSLDGQLQMKMDKADRAKYRGTVKQGALTDYVLTLRGRVMEKDSDKYPAESLRQLRSFFELCKTVRVRCKLAQIYNIDQVVMTRLNLVPTPGGMGAHDFTITLVSDDTYPYTLLKG